MVSSLHYFTIVELLGGPMCTCEYEKEKLGTRVVEYRGYI